MARRLAGFFDSGALFRIPAPRPAKNRQDERLYRAVYLRHLRGNFGIFLGR